jgi:hypothetical protein
VNSAALPKVIFSKPPITAPDRRAICSVARRSHSASGTVADAAVMKTYSGGA